MAELIDALVLVWPIIKCQLMFAGILLGVGVVWWVGGRRQ